MSAYYLSDTKYQNLKDNSILAGPLPFHYNRGVNSSYVAYIVPEGEDAGFAGVGSRHGGAAGQVQGLGWA